MSSNETRTFIAIEFPEEVIKEVARVQQLLKNFTGKLTELENLHLTLKFLGEIPEEKINKVKEQLAKIKFYPLSLSLGGIGTFTRNNQPKIVWIKINGAFDFQKQIDDSLKNLFPKEDRFMSHLTIARIKYVKDKPTFTKNIKNISIKPIKFTNDSFSLKSSELKSFGPVYKTIEAYSALKQ